MKISDRVNEELESAMTVGELIEQLTKIDPNLLVVESRSTMLGYLQYYAHKKTYKPRQEVMLFTMGKDYLKQDTLLIKPYVPFHRSTLIEKEVIIF